MGRLAPVAATTTLIGRPPFVIYSDSHRGVYVEGVATVRLIAGLGLIAVLVLAAARVLPPYLANYQLEDVFRTQALAATYSRQSEDEIRSHVLKSAYALDVPLSAEQVRVTRGGNPGAVIVSIEADYEVTVELPGYKFLLHFQPSSDNTSFP